MPLIHRRSAEGESQKSCFVAIVLAVLCVVVAVLLLLLFVCLFVCFANVSVSSLEGKGKPERCYLRGDLLVGISSYNTTKIFNPVAEVLVKKTQLSVSNCRCSCDLYTGSKSGAATNGQW